eukprot:gb/GEZN01001291.1/.p1 GENE.gb/GEZN01001291.1/~~gb/GEZN01001291.1/.p1  ORF type:complete len:881 (-),score=138.65 gb/GEZN01001291.1/:518-3046(-)
MGPAVSRLLNPIRTAAGLLGVGLTGLAGYTAHKFGNFLHFADETGSGGASSAFTPQEGVDGVLVRPGPPSALQLLPSPTSDLTPDCLFVYAALLKGGAAKEFRVQKKQKTEKIKGFGKEVESAEVAEAMDGWIYGARQETKTGLATPTGEAGDVVKGQLICWPADQFQGKLRRADAVQGYEPAKKREEQTVGRSVIAVIAEDGSSIPAYWHFQLPVAQVATEPPLPMAPPVVEKKHTIPEQPGKPKVTISKNPDPPEPPPPPPKEKITHSSDALSEVTAPSTFASAQAYSEFLRSLTYDPQSADLLRRFLSLSKEVSELPEGAYTSLRITQETDRVEVFHNRRVGKDHNEVVHRIETARDLNPEAKKIRQDVRDEIAKLRLERKHLDGDLSNLQGRIRDEGDESGDLMVELRHILVTQGQHEKRINQLETMSEVEVTVGVEREFKRAEVRLSSDFSSARERRMVPAKEETTRPPPEERRIPRQRPEEVEYEEREEEEDLSVGRYRPGRLPERSERLSRETERAAIQNSRRSSPSKSRPQTRPAVENNRPSVFVFGGASEGEKSETASGEKFDGNRWESVPDMSRKRDGCAAVNLDGQLLVIGGFDGETEYWSAVERFDPVRGFWEPRASMNSPRAFLAAAVLSGQVYALGGHRDWLGQSTVERYDAGRDRWEKVASMARQRYSFAAVVCGGFLYAMGGTCEHEGDLASVERYDERYNQWEPVASMNVARQGCAAAVLDNRIYVTGGMYFEEDEDSWNYLSSVERYDPMNDRWEMVARMLYNRNFHAASMLDGQIHVMGGWSEENVLNTVERYDAEANRWEQLDGRMGRQRAGHSAATVVGMP